jgi:hypothetical protein
MRLWSSRLSATLRRSTPASSSRVAVVARREWVELTRFSGRCRACDYRPVLNGLLFSN